MCIRDSAEGARDIFSKYLIADLPLHEHDLAEHDGSPERTVAAMIEAAVERMYSEIEANRFLEVTYANGDKAVSYTHLRAHETVLDLVCRLLLEKKKKKKT